MRALRKLVAGLALLGATSCASAPPARLPEWTALPPGIVEAFCGKLRSEAISSETAIAIVGTTESLVTPASLRALAQEYGGAGIAIPMSLGTEAAPLPLTAPAGACNWRVVTAADVARRTDEMVVQLSSPIINPFLRSEAGVFARFSVSGGDAQWYWIPLAERSGHWLVGHIHPLALRE